MIRAGDLDRIITIEQDSEVLDQYGAPTQSTSAQSITLRAFKFDNHSAELIRAWGASTETSLVFQTWFVDWVKAGDRVNYEGDEYLVEDKQEIGRRRAMQIKIERVGAVTS